MCNPSFSRRQRLCNHDENEHLCAAPAAAQALAGANSTVVFATGAIIGHTLAPSPALATVPISVFVVGMALGTLPSGTLVRRHGRKASFLAGNACGTLTGLLASLALVLRSFPLFCLAMLFGGAYASVVQSFRFAATECVGPNDKPRAMSYVLAGGVLAGVVGAQLINATMNAWPPHAYAVTYLGAAVVAMLSAVVLRGVRFERQPAPPEGAGRPVLDVLQQPQLLVAMFCGVVTYMMMNFLMTSAPLAMELCGIARIHANHGIEMHVIAMYAPSFFTGRLITRFGGPALVMTGLALTAVSAAAAMSGITVDHFWLSLVLLGVGWNFGYLGASAMVLKSHTPDEGPRVQSINDFVVFGSMSVGSFLSGGLLTTYGWGVVAGLVLAPVGAAAVLLIWLQWSSQRTPETHRAA